MRKILAALFTLALMLLCLSTALAADAPEAPIATGEGSVVEWRNPARADDFVITYTRAGISPSSGSVVISVTTESNLKSDTIGGYYYVQQYKDGQWTDYASNHFFMADSYSYNVNRVIPVTGGYYYRLVVYHRAYLNGVNKMITSTSSRVFVN